MGEGALLLLQLVTGSPSREFKVMWLPSRPGGRRGRVSSDSDSSSCCCDSRVVCSCSCFPCFSFLFVGSIFLPMSDSATSVASPSSACHVSLFCLLEGLDLVGEVLRVRIEVVGWDWGWLKGFTRVLAYFFGVNKRGSEVFWRAKIVRVVWWPDSSCWLVLFIPLFFHRRYFVIHISFIHVQSI